MTRLRGGRLILILAVRWAARGSPAASDESSLAQAFWAGIDYLGLTFKAVGNLGAGARSGPGLDRRSGDRRKPPSIRCR